MFDEIFGGEPDPYDAKPTVSQPFHRKMKNCAEELRTPQQKRNPATFVGLQNQGATCYLNSLLQCLYMLPEFRNTILRLPLCEDKDPKKPSKFVQPEFFPFTFAMQKLFAEMHSLDVDDTPTTELTDAFGWKGSQMLHQHDIQEAFRIIFDELCLALLDNEFGNTLTRNFRGTSIDYLECLSCGYVRERETSFVDLLLQVKGFQSVEESLMNMTVLEKLEGSNQYHCGNCNQKVDAYKGNKIRKFPPILMLSLNRYEYDYNTFQRKKINDRFTFNVELDVSMYTDKPDSFASEDEKIYELCAVLIHGGDAFRGHYHAYVRDILHEGDWPGIMAEKAQKEAEIQAKIKADKAAEQAKEEKKTTDEKKATEAEKNGTTDANKEQQTDQKPATNGEKKENAGEKKGDETSEKKEDVTTEKKEGKGGKKGQKEKKKGKEGQQENKKKEKGGGKKDKGKKEGNTNDEQARQAEEAQYDGADFPFAFNNVDLGMNWFDFNDRSVTAIPMNRLQKQFGGSRESAYILIYRQRALNKGPDCKKVDIPEYLKEEIAKRNQEFEVQRAIYREASRHIVVRYFDISNINFSNKIFKEGFDPATTCKEVKISLDSKAENLLEEIAKSMGYKADEVILVETVELGNQHLHFKRQITPEVKGVQVEDLEVYHLTTFAVFPSSKDANYQDIANTISPDHTPIRVNVRYNGQETRILVFQNDLYKDLKKKFQEITGIPVESQYVELMTDFGKEFITKEKESEDKRLYALNVYDNSDFFVSVIEDVQKQQEDQQKTKNSDVNVSGDEVSVLVESDDRNGVQKYFVKLDWTLQQLLDYLKMKLDISPESQRRLRKLLDKSLFFAEELQFPLSALNFQDGGIRLRLEYGKFPDTGNIIVRVKNESKFKKEGKPDEEDFICTPQDQVADLKKKVCEFFDLDPTAHKFYTTDWLGDPTSTLEKENLSIDACKIKMSDVLILRDKDSPILKELLTLEVYHTLTGIPPDSDKDFEIVDKLQIREEHTLENLKLRLLELPIFASYGNVELAQIRVRELVVDSYFGVIFGKILRDDKKQMKKFNLNKSLKIVVQVLEKPEVLEDSKIVLLVRKRDVDEKKYGEAVELVFNAGTTPQINDLKQAIIDLQKLEVDVDKIDLAKRFPQRFEWFFLTPELVKAKNQPKKGSKGGKQEETENKINLRKAPFLLTDGDEIGYRLVAELGEKKDDFQTKEDAVNKKRYNENKSRRKKSPAYQDDNVGFTIVRAQVNPGNQ